MGASNTQLPGLDKNPERKKFDSKKTHIFNQI